MRAVLVGWFAAALAGPGSLDAVAQPGRGHRVPPRGRAEAPSVAVPRSPAPTLRSRDGGIIYWNTPNKDGNLGGPGAGGSSGGG
ncbi:hypothetical protein [Methylobacterium longum]|jgi:hypothetical protein|uniref:hypothetical protein n=1 Tax=Methylobacterium longum TaxID=767694 RepID=UPI00207FDC13|nr:hypothetical protein [Methylobacterium longum]GJE10398.1 hypothetical protein FOHLNKBM_1431 [Methylobacterium longum]